MFAVEFLLSGLTITFRPHLHSKMATASGSTADLDFSDLTGEAHGGAGGDGDDHSTNQNEGTCVSTPHRSQGKKLHDATSNMSNISAPS